MTKLIEATLEVYNRIQSLGNTSYDEYQIMGMLRETMFEENCGVDDAIDLVYERIVDHENDQQHHAPHTKQNNTEKSDAEPNRKRRKLNDQQEEQKTWETTFQHLCEVLPNVDPRYIEQECRKYVNQPENLEKFISDCFEEGNYPKKEDYLKELRVENKIKLLTENFTIEQYLKQTPNPNKYFLEEKKNGSTHKDHSFSYLKEKLPDVRVNDIQRALRGNNNNLTKSYLDLERGLYGKMNRRANKRKIGMPQEYSHSFQQEVAYIEHRNSIDKYIDEKEKEREAAIRIAREKRELLECQVCYVEILQSEASRCKFDHVFCHRCIRISVKTEMGYGRTTFSCFEPACTDEFDLRVLELVLDEVCFKKMLLKRQGEEIKAAGVDDAEGCPFCDFYIIPAPEDKIFKCLNPDCLIESCRLCHKLNHIPLPCEEEENADGMNARKYIEEQMSEALMRTCWKCQRKIVRKGGCNFMRCVCGATMCYVCRTPQANCRCSSRNDDSLHYSDVKDAADKAKDKVLTENPYLQLTYDPTKNLPDKPSRHSDKPLRRRRRRRRLHRF